MSASLSLPFMLAALDAHQVHMGAAVRECSAVSTDSRSIQPGELFIALRGDKFDGHAFVHEVLAAGAAAVLVDARWAREHEHAELAVMVVDDTRRAFASLAAAWRRTFQIPVIGVVGSNGKTTVKEMIASILAAEVGAAHCLATQGNLNNDIGVPTMLLRLRPAHQAAVIEMGMNHPGETAVLAAMTEATVAMINNAQREHQVFMKTVAAVAAEHASVLAVLPADGVAVLNADDDFFADWQRAAAGRSVLSFGLTATADVHVESVANELVLVTPQGRAALSLATVGRHNIRNALGAAAATLAAGCSLAGVVAGLAAFRPVKGRLQKQTAVAGATVIDDSYNANPDSVRAAIDVLASMAGTRVLVLGDMGEVGDADAAVACHAEIGAYAASQGIETLLTLGAMTPAAVQAFGAGATHCADIDALLKLLSPLLSPQSTVLIKGSRFMRMERVVEAIRPAASDSGVVASPSSSSSSPSEGNQYAA